MCPETSGVQPGHRPVDSKSASTRARGARHGSVRFVTGALDRVDNRAAFLDLARRATIPILVIYGNETPRKSRAVIEALAGIPNVTMEQLPTGKLAIHEELADAVAATIEPFLAEPAVKLRGAPQ